MAESEKRKSRLLPRAYDKSFHLLRGDHITVDLTVRATLDEIANLGTARAEAFLNGIADVLSAQKQRKSK